MVDHWLSRVQRNWVLPCCVLCGDLGQPPALDLCVGCAADLLRNQHCCRRCAMPLPQTLAIGSECAQCRRRPPAFDGALAPYRYDYPLDRMIHAFKYQGALAIGRVLGTLLARVACDRREPAPDLLVPVPLHRARHRERGFNQAYELARPVSELLGILIDDRMCQRVRQTQDQTQLSARQRRKNLRRAFAAREDAGTRHVALIDDVLTTGSTTGELARTLKHAGVQVVEVWAVARASPGSRPQLN